MLLRAGQRTDVGRVRSENQDSILVEPPLYLVADGMGGQRGGADASRLVVEVIKSRAKEIAAADDGAAALVEAVREAHRRIQSEGSANPDLQGMGTTVTAAAETGDGHLVFVHVGDSRAYRLRGGVLESITEDDSYVQELVRLGELAAEEARVHPARNLVTKALGHGDADTLDPAVIDSDARDGDRYVICSDGLFGMLDDTEIKEVLAGHDDPQEAADALVEEANARRSSDNVSVIVVDVVSGGDEATSVDTPAAVTTDEDTGEQSSAKVSPPSEPTSFIVRPRRTRRWAVRTLLGLIVLAVLVALAVFGGRWFLFRNYYVACDDGDRVAVYRGVPHDVLGFSVSRFESRPTPLIPCSRLRLPPRGGVTVADRAEADRTVANYRCQAEGGVSCPPPGG